MNPKLSLAALSLAVAFVLFNCGSPSTGMSATGGGSGSSTDGGSDAGTGRVCTPAPAFVAANVTNVGYNPGAMQSSPYNFAFFGRPSAAAGRFDVMANDLYGPAPTGPVTLTPVNYQMCAYCFRIAVDCNDMGAQCAKLFLAQSGTVTIPSATPNQAAGSYSFTLSNMVYEEWNFATDSAADGGCLSLSSFTYSGTWP